MRKVGYLALCFYLLLVGLAATVPNLLIPSTLLAGLALIASFGIFLDLTLPTKKPYRRPNENVKS